MNNKNITFIRFEMKSQKNKQMIESFYHDGSLKHIGYYKNGVKDGYGRLYFKCGQLRYEGMFKQLEYDGEGTEFYEDGTIKFTGTFLKTPYFFYGARRYGVGKLYYKSGKLRYEGTFKGVKNYEFHHGLEYKHDGQILIHGDGLVKRGDM